MRLLAALAVLLLSVPALAQEPFDYYVLSLSWSPTWCGTKAGREDAEQCGATRNYGFVVHGLWPQYAKGGYPSACEAAPAPVPAALVESMLPIMPSRKLIQHEWKKHGTCAGAAPAEYFGNTRAAFDRLRIPKLFQNPVQPQALPVAQVEKLFQAANPGLEPNAISVICRGHHAAEVRVCLDKQLNYRACAADVRDRCKGEALFPATR